MLWSSSVTPRSGSAVFERKTLTGLNPSLAIPELSQAQEWLWKSSSPSTRVAEIPQLTITACTLYLPSHCLEVDSFQRAAGLRHTGAALRRYCSPSLSPHVCSAAITAPPRYPHSSLQERSDKSVQTGLHPWELLKIRLIVHSIFLVFHMSSWQRACETVHGLASTSSVSVAQRKMKCYTRDL